ncbi:ATP-dependent DNA helicase [Candidatus Micrarchaeota archaeon]|nr:ATP-dependent DNA helicase [Candidatus Micrarchaeota archaeon]
MGILFRHDRIRPSQLELMEDIYDAVSNGRNFMAQAPTGSGKTDAALSAAITAAVENNLNVFFLTPKISQHKIAMDVVNGIAEKHNVSVRAVDLVGRSHCCIDSRLQKLDHDSFQTACSAKIKNRQCTYYINAKGHNRLQEAKASLWFEEMLKTYGNGQFHHNLIETARKKSCCPYEWLIRLGEMSNVIIGDYYHLLNPHVREIFLMKVKKRIEDSIIIVDEAHNLANRIRSSLSRSVNNFTFMRMAKEMQMVGLDAGPVQEEFEKWAEEILGDRKEATIAAFEFDFFIQKFGLTMEDAIERLVDSGIQYVEKTNRKSACLKLAKFMEEWKNSQYQCVRILKKKNDGYFLSKRLLDPSPATRILNQCRSSILMSGTLVPLEMHLNILGLDPERTEMKSYPSPFDSGNVVNIITENHTTKYSKRNPESFLSMASSIDKIIEKTPGGVAVFFPSYGVMESVIKNMKSERLHVQSSGMKPSEIRDMLFRFGEGGVLCGVQGGSLSEGVDYPKGEIKTAVIVGVALEEMDVETRALIDYYDEKFGRGWDYGYIYPGTIKALQAAGRGRRKENDRVALVYMDERFKWNKYNWILNRDEEIIVTDKPEDEVERFWNVIHAKIHSQET